MGKFREENRKWEKDKKWKNENKKFKTINITWIMSFVWSGLFAVTSEDNQAFQLFICIFGFCLYTNHQCIGLEKIVYVKKDV